MTVDELREGALADLRGDRIPSQQGLIWLAVGGNARDGPLRVEFGDDDAWIENVWIPWLLERHRPFALAIAWPGRDGVRQLEVVSANRHDVCRLEPDGRVRADDGDGVPSRIEKYRRRIRRNAADEA